MFNKAKAFLGSLRQSAKSKIAKFWNSRKGSNSLTNRFKQFPLTTGLLFGGPVLLLLLIILVGKLGLSFFASLKWASIMGSGLWKYVGLMVLIVVALLLLRRIGWLRKQANSLGSNVNKILKDDWRRDGIAFILIFALAHFLAYHYFEDWYRPFFLDKEHHAIWWMQIFLIIWFLIKDEVKKHKVINFFAKAAIAITVIATLVEAGSTGRGMYKRWDNARLVANAKMRDSVLKSVSAAMHDALYAPPSGYTCAHREYPIDTTFIVRVDSTKWSKVIISPCGHTALAEGLGSGSMLKAEIKENATDLKSKTYLLVPGEGKIRVPIIRWMRLRAVDVPVDVRVHIFPTNRRVLAGI